MEFEFDETKDRANRTKHRIGLAEAARLDWARGFTRADDRVDYGEVRYLLYSRIGSRLFVCTFTKRGSKRRIISLRKANKREIITYG